MEKECIIVLDFGGQYNQLIARRIRECNVYCELKPYTTPLAELKAMNPKGIIFTGGPNSVYDKASPHYDPAILEAGIPILGICYGSQLIAYMGGGEVATAPVSEYGHTDLHVDTTSVLFQDVREDTVCWMSHTDYIARVPEGYRITATTKACPVAAMECETKKIYATQFHPEVMHTREGMKMLRHFAMDVCGCSGSWQMSSFAESTIRELREKIGKDHVILGLSGGVDSSVAAALLSKAIGSQLHCVFVDHGLMRKDEGDEVEEIFGKKGAFDLDFTRVNASEQFLRHLMGETDPEKKRKIIGAEFPKVFGAEAKKFQGLVKYIAQGTIYPDVVESGAVKTGDVIKSHHNVGGLPIELVRELGFDETPIEPLRMLFKDEVRKVGLELGIPRELVFRQPFPGPGLGVRIIGEITPAKIKVVQEADAIYREEVEKAAGEWRKEKGEEPAWMPAQYFAALSNMRSVGVMGDHRTYGLAVVLRAVLTSDFMTAEAAEIPWKVLQTCMRRIINEVDGVNRVLYDITSKPPGTIEME